ncbi:hypothetical protein [Microvirga guangxiensis]|uniref:Porin n=1 Tax=Microvirga guangxiensis TaxID=549386 RepID=A0A1G5L410_9HYPH|nr:hypothetical protein [Microvirga guangxiensis]SCZ07635.1 hypothetical protein SAMN02927923_03890 [Microvirga guangxiensis]
MRRLIVLASFLLTLTGSAVAKECRIPEPKPGQAIQVPDACRDTVRPKNKQDEALKSDKGAIDLGYGTTLRIGGRVRAETMWRD